MPPKKCGRCEKTVYPTEELKCLDKVWHKGCFKCQVCNMTLTMKNYKGYDKLPYCNAHYPQTKHTAIADTPEQRRIAENTKIQSNIKYHEEFERQKGKKMTIADDPEMQRVRQNMEVISNVAYHGERDRKQHMEMMRPAEQLHVGPPRHQPGRIAEYEPEEPHSGGTPYSSRNSAGARQVYDSSVGKDRVERFSSSGDDDSGMLEQPPQRKVGSISNYDPLNEKYGSIAGQTGQGQRRSQPQQQPQQPPPQQYRPPEPQQDRHSGKGMVAKAMYDYNAADTDEVSFVEGDLIVYCQPIDAGWMEGTVERTGQRGMLPSNYVESI